jgi:hypothetical protein
VLELLPDLVQEVPARGAISNMVAGRAAFDISRVELANDASFAVRRVPDEGARVSLGGEGFCWVFVAPRVRASAHPTHQRAPGLRLEQTPKSNFWDPLGPRAPYCMLGPSPPLYLLFYHVPLPLFTIHLTHLCPTQLDTRSLLL